MCRPSRVDRRASQYDPPRVGGSRARGGLSRGAHGGGSAGAGARPFRGPARACCRLAPRRGVRRAVLGNIPHSMLKQLLVMGLL